MRHLNRTGSPDDTAAAARGVLARDLVHDVPAELAGDERFSARACREMLITRRSLQNLGLGVMWKGDPVTVGQLWSLQRL
jgi:hypothetical protein